MHMYEEDTNQDMVKPEELVKEIASLKRALAKINKIATSSAEDGDNARDAILEVKDITQETLKKSNFSIQ